MSEDVKKSVAGGDIPPHDKPFSDKKPVVTEKEMTDKEDEDRIFWDDFRFDEVEGGFS